jgi:hypothetical protein
VAQASEFQAAFRQIRKKDISPIVSVARLITNCEPESSNWWTCRRTTLVLWTMHNNESDL